jgi:hypothetical protein
VARETGRSLPKVVAQAAYYVCRSAEKATRSLKQGAKRPIMTGPRGGRYVEALRQDKPPKRLYAPSESYESAFATWQARATRVPRTGFGKSSWEVMRGKIGSAGRSGVRRASVPAHLARAGLARFVGVIDGLNGIDPRIEMINEVSYLEANNPGLVAHVMTKGASALHKSAIRERNAAIKRGWRV